MMPYMEIIHSICRKGKTLIKNAINEAVNSEAVSQKTNQPEKAHTPKRKVSATGFKSQGNCLLYLCIKFVKIYNCMYLLWCFYCCY